MSASPNRTVQRSTKTSTATIIKMTDWSPMREPPPLAAAVVRMDSTTVRGVERRSPAIANLDEARQMIAKLTERNNAQGHLLQAWKQRLKQQNEMLFGLHREKEEQMRLLTSQLLLLEANLRSKQGKIDGLLNQRDRIIAGQQETIRTLERDLDRFRNSLSSGEQPTAVATRPQSLSLVTSTSNTEDCRQESVAHSTTTCTPSDRNQPVSSREVRVLGREQGDESLDDSDSAVVIDDDQHRHSPTFAQNSQVRVIRSISDVVDSSRANLSIFREKQLQQQPGGILKSTRLVRNHQRRVMFLQPEEPEVEEEEEEEEELEEDGSVGSSSSDDSPFNKRGHKTFLRGSFERMPVHQDSSGSRGSGLSSSSLRAANCSNHRSVTRPRDVKFKKNNKCSTSWKSSADGCSPCSPTKTTIVATGNQEFQTSFSHQV